MPGPIAGSAVPVGRNRTLAQVYRHFGEVDAAGTSPLYERVAVALSESGEALRAIEAAPARKRHPTLILAALHDLALAGRAPALAAAYAAADGDAAAGAAIDTLLRMTDSVVAIAVRRQTRTNETGRCAVLYPAIAEAARRVGANAVGLIDMPEGYPPGTFDAEEAVSVVALVFDHVEAERWDGKFFPLKTRDEVRAYCRHNFIPPERAEQAEVPLWLTKRGILVRARKP